MRFLEGLVLRGTAVGGGAGLNLGFCCPVVTNFSRAVGVCLYFLLYLLPFDASYWGDWGDSSSFSSPKATGLGQASGQGCFLARVTLGI